MEVEVEEEEVGSKGVGVEVWEDSEASGVELGAVALRVE